MALYLGYCEKEKRDHVSNDFRMDKRLAYRCVYCKALMKNHA
jgi:aspartate carbamoyltransferase regulatory subunit